MAAAGSVLDDGAQRPLPAAAALFPVAEPDTAFADGGHPLRVEAPDVDSALALIDRLPGIHAEIAPAGERRCHVLVAVDEVGDGRLAGALLGIERWLGDGGIAAVRIELCGRRYLFEGPPR